MTVPPWSLHPLPSLISNSLNLPLGTQGRSWRLNEAPFLKTRDGRHKETFVPRSPAGLTSSSCPPLDPERNLALDPKAPSNCRSHTAQRPCFFPIRPSCVELRGMCGSMCMMQIHLKTRPNLFCYFSWGNLMRPQVRAKSWKEAQCPQCQVGL